MSGSREEERRKLADIINHWNANRLDLFEISRPTEVGDPPGVSGEAADPQALSWVNGRAFTGWGNVESQAVVGSVVYSVYSVVSPVRAWRECMPNSIEKSGDLQRRHIHTL